MAKRNPYRKRRRTYSERQSWQPRGTGEVAWGSWVGRLVVLTAALLVAAYVLLWSPLFAPTKAEVSGNQAVNAEELKRTALEASERRFGPVIVKSLVAFDPGQVAAKLKERYPDIAQVNVSAKLPNTLKVEVKERQTTLLWKSADKYYLVDRQGTAFDTGEAGQEGLVQVEDSTGLPVELGKQVVGGKFIKVLEEVRQGLGEAGIEVRSFRIPETTFEVHAITAQGYYAIFDTTRPTASQVDALRRATATTKPREYADLRVPGRVYVR